MAMAGSPNKLAVSALLSAVMLFLLATQEYNWLADAMLALLLVYILMPHGAEQQPLEGDPELLHEAARQTPGFRHRLPPYQEIRKHDIEMFTRGKLMLLGYSWEGERHGEILNMDYRNGGPVLTDFWDKHFSKVSYGTWRSRFWDKALGTDERKTTAEEEADLRAKGAVITWPQPKQHHVQENV